MQLEKEKEGKLEALWQAYAKDASKREQVVSGLGRVDLGALTLMVPAQDRRTGAGSRFDLARVSYAWQWRKADGTWTPFGAVACAKLESALGCGWTAVCLEGKTGGAGADVCVDLVEMCMFPIDSALARHEVQRVGTPFSLAFRRAFLLRGANVPLLKSTPQYWRRVGAPDAHRLLVTIPVELPEAHRIQALMDLYNISTSDGTGTAAAVPAPPKLKLERLERLQDVDMWLGFAARRNQAVLEHQSDVPTLQFSRFVAAALTRAPVLERQSNQLYLFHGCDSALARRLIDGTGSFDAHFRASYTPALGTGYYFYESAAHAAQHASCPVCGRAGAPCRCGRPRTLLLCRVVLGGAGTVYPDGTRRHHYLSGLRPGHNVPDSAVRNAGDDTFEAVVYDPFQVYPEYIITFTISGLPQQKQQQQQQGEEEGYRADGEDGKGKLEYLADELNRMVEARLPLMAVAHAPDNMVLLPAALRPARPAPRTLQATQLLLQALDELDQQHTHEAHRLLLSALDEDGDCLPAQMFLLFLQSSHPLLGIGAHGCPATAAQLRTHIRPTNADVRERWGDVLRTRVQTVPSSPVGLFLLGEWDMLVTGATAAGERYIRQSADMGNLHAAALLGGALLAAGGECECKSNGAARVVLATDTMLRYCRRAAEGGHAYAQCVLAANLHAGTPIVARDLAAARRWWRASSRNGLPEACYHLAVSLLVDGPSASASPSLQQSPSDSLAKETKEDIGLEAVAPAAEAARWFRCGAERGHERCQVNMGYCLEHGVGVLPDARNAVRWYRAAVRQGSDPQAMWLLADCLDRGFGTARDPVTAARLRASAASSGVHDSPRIAAAVAAAGPDTDDITHWLARAAEDGSPAAAAQLAALQAAKSSSQKQQSETAA